MPPRHRLRCVRVTRCEAARTGKRHRSHPCGPTGLTGPTGRADKQDTDAAVAVCRPIRSGRAALTSPPRPGSVSTARPPPPCRRRHRPPRRQRLCGWQGTGDGDGGRGRGMEKGESKKRGAALGRARLARGCVTTIRVTRLRHGGDAHHRRVGRVVRGRARRLAASRQRRTRERSDKILITRERSRRRRPGSHGCVTAIRVTR